MKFVGIYYSSTRYNLVMVISIWSKTEFEI